MWTARVFRETSWQPVEVLELSENLSSVGAAALAEQVVGGRFRNAIAHLRAEAESPDLRRELIEIWATKAAESAHAFEFEGGGRIRALEGALAYFLPNESPTPKDRPDTIAWHDRTMIMLALDTDDNELELVYEADPREQLRVEQMSYRYGGTDLRLETSLDWRGYFGTQTAVIDGRNKMRPRGNSFIANVRTGACLFLGNVVRMLSRAQPPPLRDWTASDRRLRMFEKHRELSRICPSLDAAAPFTGESAMVFVHGTMSCGLQGLSDLYPGPSPVPPGQVFRFEHDTFDELAKNGNELADLVRQKLNVKRLLFVAHSRGGLVAQFAKAALRNTYASEVHLKTFGTPYQGTPLVDIGGRLLNVLCKVGEELLGAVPVVSPLAKAYSFLFDSPKLPLGIELMSTDSQALPMLRLDAADCVECWGSDFDVNTGAPSGYGFDVENVLLGAMKGRAHDLVVPLSSALAFGAPMQKLSCSHAQYFLQRDVHATINQFFRGPPGVAVPPSADAYQPSPGAVLTAPGESRSDRLKRGKRKDPFRRNED